MEEFSSSVFNCYSFFYKEQQQGMDYIIYMSSTCCVNGKKLGDQDNQGH